MVSEDRILFLKKSINYRLFFWKVIKILCQDIVVSFYSHFWLALITTIGYISFDIGWQLIRQSIKRMSDFLFDERRYWGCWSYILSWNWRSWFFTWISLNLTDLLSFERDEQIINFSKIKKSKIWMNREMTHPKYV